MTMTKKNAKKKTTTNGDDDDDDEDAMVGSFAFSPGQLRK
jgi:hypothetical protein